MEKYLKYSDVYGIVLHCPSEVARVKISELPVQDVVPLVHAYWIRHEDEFGATDECSNCHMEGMCHGNYCPHCGARMDKYATGGIVKSEDYWKKMSVIIND